jgi:tetratricopeptide (TPR) repeat protein
VERTRALWITRWIAYLQGDNAASLQLLSEAMAVAEFVGDETELTYAIQFLGDAEKWAGNLPRAVELLDDAMSRYDRRTTWTAPALLVFTQRGQAAGLLGDVEQAVELRDKCHAICAKLGERWVLSWTEWNLSVTWWAAGDTARAAVHARDSLRLKRELNDRLGIPFCVELLAWTAVAGGEYEHAAVLPERRDPDVGPDRKPAGGAGHPARLECAGQGTGQGHPRCGGERRRGPAGPALHPR